MKTCTKCGWTFPADWITHGKEGACRFTGTDGTGNDFCSGRCLAEWQKENGGAGHIEPHATVTSTPHSERIHVRFAKRVKFDIHKFRELDRQAIAT